MTVKNSLQSLKEEKEEVNLDIEKLKNLLVEVGNLYEEAVRISDEQGFKPEEGDKKQLLEYLGAKKEEISDKLETLESMSAHCDEIIEGIALGGEANSESLLE